MGGLVIGFDDIKGNLKEFIVHLSVGALEDTSGYCD